MQADVGTSGSLREFIEFVAGMLAKSPDEISVEEEIDGSSVAYRLRLAPDDVGRVIGREGRTVRAIRSLIRAAAVRQGIRVTLDVDDRNRDRPAADDDQSADQAPAE
jgi:predicted RNA-binding protein YlqC (UPF0109 family)